MLARDIIAKQARQQTKRYESFEQVVSRCFKTINKSIDVLRNNHHCLFEVPEFIIGYPLYDLNECIEYVVRKLNTAGFYVRYFFPRILYISWGPPPLPALLPPTPAAAAAPAKPKGKVVAQPTSKIVRTKKNTGKYVLDLS